MAETWVAWQGHNQVLPERIDYILVLGANGNIESPVVIDRAASAFEAHQKYPMAEIILSGKPAEVEVYKTLLSAKGLSKFIEEPESATTWDNVRSSEKFIKPGSQVLIVTSEYHQPRALAMARSLKWKAWSYGKDAREYKMKMYFFVKERFSNCKYLLPMVLSALFH